MDIKYNINCRLTIFYISAILTAKGVDAMSVISGKRLQEVRKEKGVSQRQAAKDLGISPQSLSAYEQEREPTYDLLIQMAEYYGTTTDYLVGRLETSGIGEGKKSANGLNPEDRYANFSEGMLNYYWYEINRLLKHVDEYACSGMNAGPWPFEMALECFKYAAKIDDDRRTNNTMILHLYKVLHKTMDKITDYKHAWIEDGINSEVNRDTFFAKWESKHAKKSNDS